MMTDAGYRTCAAAANLCVTQLSINHRPLDCHRHVTFWIDVEHSTLTLGSVDGQSRTSTVLAEWSPDRPRSLRTLFRYMAVNNELSQLDFTLYRDVDINTCYVNETLTTTRQQVGGAHIK